MKTIDSKVTQEQAERSPWPEGLWKKRSLRSLRMILRGGLVDAVGIGRLLLSENRSINPVIQEQQLKRHYRLIGTNNRN